VSVLVPVDVLRPRRVDEHFAAEARAAQGIGLDVALVHNGGSSAVTWGRALAAVPAGGEAS
jgi:hypothetical protein